MYIRGCFMYIRGWFMYIRGCFMYIRGCVHYKGLLYVVLCVFEIVLLVSVYIINQLDMFVLYTCIRGCLYVSVFHSCLFVLYTCIRGCLYVCVFHNCLFVLYTCIRGCLYVSVFHSCLFVLYTCIRGCLYVSVFHSCLFVCAARFDQLLYSVWHSDEQDGRKGQADGRLLRSPQRDHHENRPARHVVNLAVSHPW